MSGMLSTGTSDVQLEATPLVALVDDKVTIVIRGLLSSQSVTLAASMDEDSKILVSYAHYKADEDGMVDVNVAESLGGTYTGIEPMGLFWSMIQADGQNPGVRVMKKDVTKPLRVTVSVIPNNITVTTKEHVFKDSMACVELERYYMAENVRKIIVKELDKDTRIRGTLFLPTAGPGPFPGVIDMFGTAGGLLEYKAALLASRGFASLALAYYDYDDLPNHLTLQLEYFVEAVDWLYSQPQVLKTGIGVVGVSKGAELAIHMAILNPKVRAVVPINTYYYSHTAIHLLGGVEQLTVGPDMDFLKMTEEAYEFDDCCFLNEVPEDAELRVEEAKQAQFLFLYGQDDRAVHPGHLKKLIARFKKHGMKNYRYIEYPKAGHLLEPPYTPLARKVHNKYIGCLLLFGGECKPHADAQEHSWREIQLFLWKQLAPDTKASKL